MKRAAVALLLALGCLCIAQTPGSAGVADPEAFRISVDVDLVVLQATVRDRAGHTVPKLTQQDFEAFEDGAPQSIRLFRHEDTPVTVGLVIDHSSSMRSKLADVTAGARAFVRSSNPNDQMFVVNFNESVTLGLPAGVHFSDNADQLANAIWGAPPIGMTALNDAIIEALKQMRGSTNDKKVLLVISDGADNASKADLNRVLKLTEQSSAMIYTIGIFNENDTDSNPKVLRRLAQESGGEAFFPEQLDEAVAICERIARDIRDQYTIGYSSTNQKLDGAFRKVRLTTRGAKDGKLSVRARAGYRAGPGTPSGKDAAAR